MNTLRIVFGGIIGLAIASSLFFLFGAFSESNKTETVITNHMIVEKIESIGKLELCKMYVKDIIEQKEVKSWYIPDAKVMLIISGEATGCIDLKLIDSTSITMNEGIIRIKLPEPTLCYIKINHQESKVYDIQNEYFNKAKLIDKAYAMAEKNIEKSVLEMNILQQTKDNAQATLKPLLESFIGKKVELYF